jgi:hypothetical protein
MKNDMRVAGNAQPKKWRVVSKHVAACDACKDTGSTVLIRCGHDKCPREFHVDCAFHQGGLLMDDNGSVSVFCEAHFKPILFCSCKEPYNEARPMIFCDECCDWFHNSCEGVHGNISDAQRYTCRSCREILKQGRTVSKVLQEKNAAKEERSMWQQNASKAIGLMSELEGGLCPIIDEISRPQKTQYSIKEITDAKDVLSNSPFISPPPGAEDAAAMLLISLGVMPVIDRWRTQLNTYLDNYELWFNRANQVCSESSSQIEALFTAPQMAIVREVCAKLRELSAEAVAAMQGTPTDLDGFHAYCEAVFWMEEFLQVSCCFVSSYIFALFSTAPMHLRGEYRCCIRSPKATTGCTP